MCQFPFSHPLTLAFYSNILSASVQCSAIWQIYQIASEVFDVDYVRFYQFLHSYLTTIFFKLVQRQPRPNQKTKPVWVKGVPPQQVLPLAPHSFGNNSYQEHYKNPNACSPIAICRKLHQDFIAKLLKNSFSTVSILYLQNTY